LKVKAIERKSVLGIHAEDALRLISAARLSLQFALDPWLCVTAFQQFCPFDLFEKMYVLRLIAKWMPKKIFWHLKS